MKSHIADFFRNFKFEYKITLNYLIFGFLWILFSDKVLDVLEPDDSLLTQLQTYKGTFFIIVTSGFLYLLVRKHMQKIRHVESQRLESEFRFNVMYENGPFGMFMADKNFRFINVNPSFRTMTGYSEAELLKLSFKEITHPDDMARSLQIVDKLLDREVSVCKTEKRYLCKDGQVIWGSLTIMINYNSDGKFLYIIGIVEDITQRKQAEEKVLRSNENFSRAFNFNPVSLAITTVNDGRLYMINDAFTRNMGYTTDEIIGKTVNDFNIYVNPDDRQVILNTIRENGSIHNYEMQFRTKAGTLIYVELSMSVIQIDGLDYLLTALQNITDRKQLEISLTQKNNEYEEINRKLRQINIELLEAKKKAEITENNFILAFNSSPISQSITYTETGEIVAVNDEFCKLFGYSRDELIGRNASILKDLANESDENFIIKQIKTKGYIRQMETTIHTKSGEIRSILTSIEKTIWNNKPCVISSILDITERKLAEENSALLREIEIRKQTETELQRAKQEADLANRAKSEFLSRMSHELRTPMNSILGFGQLLEMGELQPIQRKGVNHILKNGNHLLDLINEVLDISGIESGRQTLNIESVQLSSIISEATDILKPASQKRNQALEVIDYPSNQLFVHADSRRLRQVLINLINNAIKYNHDGGYIIVKSELVSDNEGKNPQVRISVQDNGQGIKKENLPKLFKPFERLGVENTNTEGTGLGLDVVKKLTVAMGGTVGVESEYGAGSTFWIELPVDEERYKGNNDLHTGKSTSEIQISKETGTILYIEDNISNIELVREIILNFRPSINLITTRHGKETVQLAVEHKPDLILLDLSLPDIKGNEVLKNLLHDNRTQSIPVIIVSADAIPMHIENLMKAGATNYLTKPLDVIKLLNVVDEWVDNEMK